MVSVVWETVETRTQAIRFPLLAVYFSISWLYFVTPSDAVNRMSFPLDSPTWPRLSMLCQLLTVFLISKTVSNWQSIDNLGHVGLSNGNDILFTASDGVTKYNHEIEKYTASNGNLIAWVRVSTVSHTTDTMLYM